MKRGWLRPRFLIPTKVVFGEIMSRMIMRLAGAPSTLHRYTRGQVQMSILAAEREGYPDFRVERSRSKLGNSRVDGALVVTVSELLNDLSANRLWALRLQASRLVGRNLRRNPAGDQQMATSPASSSAVAPSASSTSRPGSLSVTVLILENPQFQVKIATGR